MIRNKREILDILDDIFVELEAQHMEDVTVKDVLDYALRHRKKTPTSDAVLKTILLKYLKEVKSYTDECNKV